MSSRGRALFAVVGVWLLSTIFWLTPGVTKPDGAGYFSYLPSVYFDHDLLLFNQWQQFGLIREGRIFYKEVTATDHLGNHWTAAPAILWAPAYVAGDFLRSAVPSFAKRWSRSGLALPYNVPVVAASAVAGLLTMLVGFFLGRRIVGDGSAALGSIAVWLGSPLLFYALENSLMSHVLVALVTACVVALAVEVRREPSRANVFLCAFAVGFAFALRPQTLPFILVPLLVVERSQLLPVVRHAAAALAGLIAGALPQLVVSQFLYGSPLGFLRLGGGDPGRPWRPFERIWIWEPLFSWYHGLATWTPLLLVALLGFILLWKRDAGLGRAAVAMFGLQWLINATMERSFWGASAFGQRRFESCTIFFVLSLAVLIDRWPRRVIALLAMCCSWTVALSIAASSNLDLNRYYRPGELFAKVWEALGAFTIAPLAHVPSSARGVVALFAIVGGVISLLVAWGALRAHRRWWWSLPLASLLASIVLLCCGLHDRAVIPEYEALIRYNRSLGLRSGGTDTRAALLQFEADYLERSGRTEEAARTRAESLELERLRRSSGER